MGCNLSKQRPVRPQRPTSDVSSSSKSHDGKKHGSKYKEVSEICVTYVSAAAAKERDNSFCIASAKQRVSHRLLDIENNHVCSLWNGISCCVRGYLYFATDP